MSSMGNTIKPIIAVDMDDVLFDFLGEFMKWHNQRFGTKFVPSDMVYAGLWELWGGTKEEARRRVLQFWEDIDMQNIEPINGSQETLAGLRDSYSLIVVSARDSSTYKQSEEWINHYFPGVFDNLYLGTSDPMAQTQPKRKSELCLELGATLLIDDQLVHARECSDIGIEVLLFGNQAHNQISEMPPGVSRAADWKHVGRVLQTN